MENYQLLTIVGANLLVFIGFMGSVIALHIQANNRINAIQGEIRNFNIKYMEETKDFHKRLCEIEAAKLR